jgi:uncharacterized protein
MVRIAGRHSFDNRFAVNNSNWILRQTWKNLLFMHWRVPMQSLHKFLPPGLELDTFQGEAWIGVVPFHMTDVALRSTPGFSCPELNVRTYVTHKGTPGVWFLSLDIANPLLSQAARFWYHLPYFYAGIKVTIKNGQVDYESRRKENPAVAFSASYRPLSTESSAKAGSLEHWLVERYLLYSASRGKIYRAKIHHTPWALKSAEVDVRINTMTEALGIHLPNEKPLLHYSQSKSVKIWNIEKINEK